MSTAPATVPSAETTGNHRTLSQPIRLGILAASVVLGAAIVTLLFGWNVLAVVLVSALIYSVAIYSASAVVEGHRHAVDRLEPQRLAVGSGFAERDDRHQAAVFRAQPSAPVRAAGVPHVGHARIALRLEVLRWRGHAPAGADDLWAVRSMANNRRDAVRVDVDRPGLVAGPIDRGE